MTVLDFKALLDQAEKAPAVEIRDLKGETIKLRRFENLPGADFKAVLNYIDIIQSDKVSENVKIESMDKCLIAAADRKDSLKDSLDKLPMNARNTVFEAWMDNGEAGNG